MTSLEKGRFYIFREDKMALQTIKGTYDVYGDRLRQAEMVETLFKHFMDLYGYTMMRTPIIENRDVFYDKSDTSDMVTKEMYSFSLNSKDYITLRPEGTRGVVRSLIEHKLYSLEMPIKLSYIGSMFRHERPQKGRQREFTQLGVENFGEKNPLVDAEVIAMGYFYLKTLGVDDIVVYLNTLGDEASRSQYSKALESYFKSYEEDLCEDCKRRLSLNPLRILDCKIDGAKDFVLNAPKMQDYLSEESKVYFEKVLKALDELGVPYKVNDRLVRGLDYYTDTVFEVVSLNEASGSQSTIFGGGRYDKLVEKMGGPKLSGIGFAIGEERLLILMEALGLLDDETRALDAYIINMLEDDPYALKVAEVLRHNGFMVKLNYYKRSMKSQFKSADREKAKFVIIIAESEKAKNEISIKDQSTALQESVKLEDLCAYLDEKFKGENEDA